MKIQTMKLSDFKELYALWKKAGLRMGECEFEQKEFTMMLQLNHESCFVCVIDTKIIGSVMGIFNGRRAWIYHLAVDPVCQRNSIGSTLLKTVENSLKQIGATKIRLWVEFSNLSVFPFYAKNGYRVLSDAIMMGKDFSFEGNKMYEK